MPWFKVDDTLAFHAKVVAAGNEAMGLWVRAGSWSSQQLTDGFIPDHMIAAMGGGEDRLIEVGLWTREDGGCRFHEWEQAQFTRAEIEAKREAERDRKRKQRRTPGGQFTDPGRSPGGVPAGHPAGQDAESPRESHRPVPSRPDPTRPDPKEPSSAKPPAVAEPPRADVEALCTRLRNHIAGNTSKTPNITAKWRTEARLLLDRDDIPFDEAVRVLDWCQQDQFWKSNILSMPKFREKFSALQIKSHQSNVSQFPARQTASEKAQGWLNTVDEAVRLMGGNQ